MSPLRDLVLRKIRELGPEAAAEFFQVSRLLVRQWEKGSKSVSLAAVERVFSAGPEPVFLGQENPASWAGKDTAILLPWYKTTHPLTAFSILGLMDRAKMSVLMNFGDAFVVHARNTLATQFLQSGLEWSFWVDDDMVLPWGNAGWFNGKTKFNFPDKFAGLHSINRLRSHGKPVVGGLYFGRSPDGPPLYAEGWSDKMEREYARRAPHDLCKPTKWVATGALLVHRDVYLGIQKKFPELAPSREGLPWNFFSNSEDDLYSTARGVLDVLRDSSGPADARVARAQTLLERGLAVSKQTSRPGQGEDVTFCLRASAAGFQPHVDLGLVCGHVGNWIYGPRR